MATLKKKTKTPRTGRPNLGISEVFLKLRTPAALVEAADVEATKVGISSSEAWRRAMRLWLALPLKVRKGANAVQS
jgi:hypothetical protein